MKLVAAFVAGLLIGLYAFGYLTDRIFPSGAR